MGAGGGGGVGEGCIAAYQFEKKSSARHSSSISCANCMIILE